MKRIFLSLAFLLFLTAPSWAQGNSTFTWDLSISEPLGAGGGYNLYASKQSGVYDSGKIVGTVAPGISTITIDTTALRGRWYFVATAFIDDAGTKVESQFSNEVTAVFKPEPPTNLNKAPAE